MAPVVSSTLPACRRLIRETFAHESALRSTSTTQMNTKKWLYVRLAVVAMFTSGGPSFSTSPPSGIPAALLIVVFVAAYFSIVSSLKRAHRNEHDRHNWEPPTWFTNPFSGALQFSHMGSFCFMGLGMVATIVAAFSDHDIVLPAFPAVFGFAIYLGMRRYSRLLNASNTSTTL